MTALKKLASATVLATAAAFSAGANATGSHGGGHEQPYPENPTPSAPSAGNNTSTSSSNANAGANAGAISNSGATSGSTSNSVVNVNTGGSSGGAGGQGGAGGTSNSTANGGKANATGGTSNATGGASRATGGAAQGVGNVSVGGSSMSASSRSLGLSLSPVQAPVAPSIPGNTQCPDATSSGWSMYLFGMGETKSAVNMECLDLLGKQASEMADKTEFYKIVGLLAQSQDKNKVTYALSAFRRANVFADDGARIVVENILACPTLPSNPSFEILATQEGVTKMAGFVCAPVVPVVVEAKAEAKAVVKASAHHAVARKAPAAAATDGCVTKPAVAKVCPGAAPEFKLK